MNYTHTLSEKDFLSLFNLRDISYEEFVSVVSITPELNTKGEFNEGKGGKLEPYFMRVTDGKQDTRRERFDLFKRQLYKMLVVDREKLLLQWFNRYGKLPEPLEYYFEIPDDHILESGVFLGWRNRKFSKVCRNINFDALYNTKKMHVNDNEFVFAILRSMFEDYQIRWTFVGPAMFDYICNIEDEYRDFWEFVMMAASKPSIFNPSTYREIMDELFEGDTIFAPVMGWNAYQFGFYSTEWKHFIATDVIPEVVENGINLHKDWTEWNANRSVLFHDEKTVDLYCCPSEQLQTRHGFVDKYRGKVDAVLFSPPYFDLEIYDSPDQSFTNFPNYDDWLRGYWEETVKIAAEVLRKKGRFAFVISNYTNRRRGNQKFEISTDMRDVVSKHLKYLSHYKIKWNSKWGHKTMAGKMKEGNFEDLWLFEKR